MYGFQKMHLKINIIKIKPQKHIKRLVMLLRMLNLHSSKPNVSEFPLQRILKISNAKMISSACLPAVRPGSTKPRDPVFSHNPYIIVRFTNLLFRRRFIHCMMVFPFIPYCLAFFLKKGEKLLTKGENSQKTCQQASSYA